MKRDERIPPIEAVEKALRVKPIGRIQLFKRPEYMPKEKANNQSLKKKEDKEEKKDGIVNRASHAAGRVGVTVDYKV
ncbi:hypothetical protein [Pelosinus fermentans]|jgi:hypothetical protein|uniref:Uncharacterized protein n=1 Tax=Pelosinus fermentans JBW45 TaxID=1192197 RepID=I9NXT7_9FIRM|nr:hypothetical protein [Pelosinus fermentans]AJQ27394.1 hypothetical protein JBW_02044 [Pelosinus fermentans JBW45]